MFAFLFCSQRQGKLRSHKLCKNLSIFVSIHDMSKFLQPNEKLTARIE